MKLTVNGDIIELPDGSTVAALMQHMQIESARVAIERNHDVVPRRRWAEVALAEGDQVEIVTFVGGG
jgi:sulfur carrier protein